MSKRKRFATFAERLQLVEYVRYCCYKRLPVTDTYLYEHYHTSHALVTMMEKKIINNTTTDNVYFWNKGAEDALLPGIVTSLWKKFGRTPTEQIPEENSSAMTTEKTPDILEGQKQNFIALLREAVTMCANYGCANYGAYITHYINERL